MEGNTLIRPNNAAKVGRLAFAVICYVWCYVFISALIIGTSFYGVFCTLFAYGIGNTFFGAANSSLSISKFLFDSPLAIAFDLLALIGLYAWLRFSIVFVKEAKSKFRRSLHN
jgi:hypothetical protein